MIVREENGSYVLINQHDHGLLAGALAGSWGNAEIPALPEPSAAFRLAVSMHDLSWESIDCEPLLDPASQRPYSFQDEPLHRRLTAYPRGISKVEDLDPYPGLLCSLHYTSFFPDSVVSRLGAEAEKFVMDEMRRQARIRTNLRAEGRQGEVDRSEFDLGLLKLMDHLSLYVCLNRPGLAKPEEHPWYRDGFSPTRVDLSSPPLEGSLIRFHANWLDPSRIALTPFPFQGPLECRLRFRRVRSSEVKSGGYAQLIEATPYENLEFRWVPG